MDWYGPMLYKMYRALGGKIEYRSITMEDLHTDARPSILAAGLGSAKLTGMQDGKCLAGHLILLDVSSELQRRASKLLRTSTFESYDISPPLGSYEFNTNGENIHGDLYMYLRAAGTWVLGGSRIPCVWKHEPDWQPEFSGISTLPLNRRGAPGKLLDVPAPIWELNVEIISHLLDVDITSHVIQRDAALGVRYLTTMPEVGTEISRESKAPCLAYYGYGGSGVTCSWGVAFDAVKELRKRNISIVPQFRMDEVARASAEFMPIVKPLQNLALEILNE
jgi:hypothetical protein